MSGDNRSNHSIISRSIANHDEGPIDFKGNNSNNKSENEAYRNSFLVGIAGIAIGSLATCAWSAFHTSWKRKGRIRNQKAEDQNQYLSETVDNSNTTIPPELRAEQLSRNALYFGKEGMERIENASVLVVGAGGVGSHAIHMLARAGIQYLRIVDFDQVTLSSLNRHACATLEDVGIPKVKAIQRFLKRLCPDQSFLTVDARVQMYTGDEKLDGDMLEAPENKEGNKKWDFVLDAIDDVPTKARLLAHCIQHDWRVISCMGAGGKSDMTRLHISDLKTASKDPLATKLRQTLKRILKKGNNNNNNNNKNSSLSQNSDSYLSDMDKVAIVYSSEKTVVKLADFTDEQKEMGVQSFGAVDNMRIRVLPVLGTMPAIMGQSMAAVTLCEIGNKPFTPMSGERVGRNVRHRLFQHLKNREKKIRDQIEAKISSNKDVRLVTYNHYDNDRFDADNISTMPYEGETQENEMTPRLVKGNWVGPIQIDVDDIEYVLAEVWRNRCCVTGESLGTVLGLARWDLSKPSNCQNLVLLGVAAMQRFDNAAEDGGDGRDSIPLDLRRRIEARLKTCRPDSRA